ncbi:M23 family metallopeptidase [Psychrobium sp. MM17-31]|uniref:M23 family metallopeptidase n=1 Tax=Psychrobium sp. MM17-31 TaxID=2917758 RepID=UPI001EF59F64|nr:M23 family metallopeptidase [Psychrobium sp. MM17-31]MCG7530813.1 M23 family metallopeptidase [Psychrobium sp. MM17-31]
MYRLILIIFLLFSHNVYSDEIFKYKDASGKWVYTDKRPLDLKKDEYKSVKFKRESLKVEPRVYTRRKNGKIQLVANNPYHAPVEFLVKSTQFSNGSKKFIVSAASREVLLSKPSKLGKYKYRWRLGDSAAKPDNFLYKIPVSSRSTHEITQAFYGAFSHSKEPSKFAVDIALPLRTNIIAARDGIVIWVKDDYQWGGKSKFFLDKANYIKILHKDGTYATYAHIIAGSATVKAGDTVETGDLLAKSGSSGYSTGPHLHFVVRKNSGARTVSVPFRFIASDGAIVTPRKGMRIDALKKRFVNY